jgi:hypothetical protein
MCGNEAVFDKEHKTLLLESLSPKRSLTQIFDFKFFHESVSPWPLSIPLGPFQIFYENSQRYPQLYVYRPVNDTSDKLFTGVNDTGNKLLPVLLLRSLRLVLDFHQFCNTGN